ncbi:juvenile hormone esterase-like isoform X2 [Daktulosphaira vitifoliae]|nr:juvenile hormone esterase-like isoform X2 [Daktulosphaira vitifoliae]
MFLCAILILLFVSSNCEPIINTKNGLLKGRIAKSRNGRNFYSFTGIPYAMPPINELRFEAPIKIDSWNETLDATREANVCVQKNVFFVSENNKIIGSEDCLYLNVYTPKINGKMPVMFWIHGGGFSVGSGGSSSGGPQYFMDKDIILVSINYRLGIFGFLSSEDNVIPGNFGLKDQVMALKWVKNNIEYFGGDPNSVTIFGESAGGASVGYHMLSPMSKGLFHKAILQSGTSACRWATPFPGLSRHRTQAVAVIAGCNEDTSEEILECLRSLSANDIAEIFYKLFEWKTHPIILFSPVVEKCDIDNKGFLCHHPLIEFKQESHVPAIIGINSAEGGLFVSRFFNKTSLLEPELITDFHRIIPKIMIYNRFAMSEDIIHINERLMDKYIPARKIEDHMHANLSDLFGDGSFLYCAIDMSEKLTSPVYFYLYDYSSEFTLNKFYGNCEKPLGVSHGDELIKLFNYKDLFGRDLNEENKEFSRFMINLWSNFATSSEPPTINGLINGQLWPAYTSVENFQLLYINSSKPQIKKNSFNEKYQFWNNLPILSRLHKFIARKNTDFNKGSNKVEL